MRDNLPAARGLLPLLLLLLLWQVLQPGPSPYFPGPARWWTATVGLYDRERLLAAFASTTVSFLEGLALAIIAGAAIGMMVGISTRAARALQPLLEFMRAIPPPVTVPVAALLIGYNETMKLTVVVLSATLADPAQCHLGSPSDRSAAARRRAHVPSLAGGPPHAASSCPQSCRRC